MNIKKRIPNKEFNKLKRKRDEIKRFIDNLQNSNDIFFETCYLKNLKINEIVHELKIKHDHIIFDDSKIQKNGSSGSLNYSLCKILYEFILNNKFKINNDYKFIIDEVEKYLHTELLSKICDMLIILSQRISVIVTTHSPIFLEKIFFVHKRYLKSKKIH